MTNQNHSFDTRSIHIGEEPEYLEGSNNNEVVVPIYLSSTFARKQVNNFMLQMLNKKSKKIENVIVKKDIIESDNENVILTMEEFNKIFNN